MIAEEKYRQQRKAENQRQSSGYNIVRTESQNQNISGLKKDVLLQNTKEEVPLTAMDSEVTVAQTNPVSQSLSQELGGSVQITRFLTRQ